MIEIIRATTDQQFLIIEQLAEKIWKAHYTPIIGAEQVAYMLEKFQSFTAMKLQVQDGLEYYELKYNNVCVGYIGFKNEEENLFLSKVYVDADYRGKSIGKKAIQFVEEQARHRNKKGVRLTVNKYNENSIAVYKKMNFKVIDDVVADIGKGYVMDDYILVKSV
ncbi:GNAT family N-acetyltransferase [Flammeovirga kamogawensis]|uniref:GNAT family N-acetyltransferase n=1 Tax=Flammeovirga kamogawensis TaxID=373891 RepID=A0ABX8GYV7_9BACT|nr:GNAT family N-acetyltransferase [Flammeovirga kamogawensis]MBB6459026.1 ribosomal protein S18 acetylase RimI-like enzyme [Flammeovirga kamogawensis]QWG08598.1 GNAT family N-acetyltransferase [Flammeovirga kamogawensis]TRX66890.1 GNAT family N-acetyltransferase [Flammeovirga kamogawensis]